MAHENISNELANADRKRRLDVVRVKLRSQRPSDIFGAILEVRKLFQENAEDQEVYEALLDAVRDNPGLRQEIRSLLEEMIKRGSKSAAGALRVLPADVKDLMADADDAYYTADYDQAIELYRQVMEKDPANVRVREQLAKAELNRIAGMPDTELPRVAIQHFRRARSHIAARDFVAATILLNAALEEARVRGMDFPEAEKLINNIQDLWTADEYKAKADFALKNEQWGNAWDLYNKALLLNPHDQVTKELIAGLDNLMRADALLDSLSEQQSGEKERTEKLEKIDGFLKTAEEIKTLVSTSLLKNSRARYNQYQVMRAKRFSLSRFNWIAIVIILLLLVIIAAILSPFWKEWWAGSQLSTIPTITSMLLVFRVTPISTNTLPNTTTTLLSILATETMKSAPLTTLWGYGKVKADYYSLEEPNGKRIGQILYRNRFFVVMDIKTDHGVIWYRCRWKINSITSNGWIPEVYIEFTLPPAPKL